MKADNDTKITAFSMCFGALLFVVCVVISCEHVGKHRRHFVTGTVDVSRADAGR